MSITATHHTYVHQTETYIQVINTLTYTVQESFVQDFVRWWTCFYLHLSGAWFILVVMVVGKVQPVIEQFQSGALAIPRVSGPVYT